MPVSMPTSPVELIRRELPFPTQVDNIHLTGAAVTVTKPARAAWALILPSVLAYACGSGAATVPSATVVDGSQSFPIYPQYGIFLNVKSLASFSLNGTADVAVCWYAEQAI